MSEELKPCPFCGHVGTHPEDAGYNGYGCERCDNCSASGPVVVNPDGKAKAIAAWNRRPTNTGEGDSKLMKAARSVLSAYDECSGAEPSLSVLFRALDLDLRPLVDAALEAALRESEHGGEGWQPTRDEIGRAMQNIFSRFWPDEYEEAWPVKAMYAVADAMLDGSFDKMIAARRATLPKEPRHG